MNFRQRFALLLVVGYLGLSFGILYYIFEISNHYNTFALEHVEKFHQEQKATVIKDSKSQTWFWYHMTDLPLSVWLLIFLLPYLQIFFMLLACTRTEPKMSIAYMWPGLLYFKYQQLFKRFPGQQSKAINSTEMVNGHSIIDT